MTQIEILSSEFPVWLPSQSPPHLFADEDSLIDSDQHYLSTQFDPLSAELSVPSRRPTHDTHALLGVPVFFQSPSFGKDTNGQSIRESIDPSLDRLRDLVDILHVTPPPAQVRARSLFLAPATLSEQTKRIIGENGVIRFEEFRTYANGWDYGRGGSLSSRSVSLLNSFLKRLPELSAIGPSLFLTHSGYLQLGWEDLHGSVVELEFCPDRIEYYIESLNQEDSVGLADQDQLITKVRLTIT